MLFEELVSTSQKLAKQRSRIKKRELLSECLQQLDANELPIAVKYLCGELPQGKIGIGGAAVRKVLTALPAANFENAGTLAISDVHHIFSEIATIKGAGSTKLRSAKLTELFGNASDAGRSFLVKLILGEMRHGAVEGVMAEAIAKSAALDPPLVRKAAMLSGDLASVAVAARTRGEEGVSEFSLELFRPVQPMLAEPVDNMEAAMTQLGQAVLEYKLDGVRVQVHKDGEDVRVFTRHLKEVTDCVPEVVDLIRTTAAKQLVLDGEVLALREDGRPLPFQTTMKRFGRSKQVDALRQKLPLTTKFFDCIRYDDQDLIDKPTTERHEALATAAKSENIIPRLVTSQPDEAQAFLQAAMQSGHEGVMAKSVDAEYMAGSRGKSWLKIKPSHTLDLAILAAEWGSGRRQGWLSNLHLGARIGDSGEFAMIGKTFKGLTDKLLKWQTEELLGLETHREDYVVHVKPKLVAEIAFNEVQQSPHYKSGFALRFARVKRYREDKVASEADTLEMVEAIFRQFRE